MRPYFEKMADFGTALKKGQIKRGEENAALLKQVETQVAAAAEGIKQLGLPEEKVNARGEMTLWQRLNYLVDADTWHPLHTLFNPLDNEEGTTNVVDGIGRISGKWAVIIGFDNKVMAGAWLAGQSENILRVTDLAKRLNVPLVWLVNCSGAKLSEQHKFYANRRGAGAPFYRHAQLNQMGIPVLAAIFGTNPAGGGYQAISPTVLFAHKECNIAVGGAGIVSGMAPKGGFDTASAQELIENTRQFKSHPPGSAQIHYNQTGFFRYLYEEEEGVLDGLKSYMRNMPAYDPEFFRVAAPCAPKFATDELYTLLPIDQKKVYAFDEILARLVDGSEHMAFRPDYGPEIYTGLCKMDGYLVACIGNRQGYLGKDYPEYAEYPGMGGKLYRQGMLKMNEFVILCQGQNPDHLVAGHLGHRRRGCGGKSRTAGDRAKLDLFDRKQRCAPDAGAFAQGFGRCPLPDGRSPGQQHKCFQHRHGGHRGVCDARRDSGRGHVRQAPGQGRGQLQATRADYRKDESDRRRL